MLLDIHPDNPDDRKIKEVISILENDGLIVIPTDTIYAFATSIKSKKGLEKLAKIKEVNLKNLNSTYSNNLSEISSFTKPIDRKIFCG